MRKKAPAAAAVTSEPAETIAPANSAGVVVSGSSECGMKQDTWSGLPHWSCTACGFETLTKTEADRHLNACPAAKPGG